MGDSTLSYAIALTLSARFAHARSLDFNLDSSKLFDPILGNLKVNVSKRDCYSLDNYSSNFNFKNNFRTQVYNSGKNKYSRKHN